MTFLTIYLPNFRLRLTDADDIQSYYYDTLDHYVNRDMKKYLRIYIYHIFKATYTIKTKAFISISLSTLNSYNAEFNKKHIEEDLLFLNLITGFNFKYIWKNKNSDLIVYWEYKNEDKLPISFGSYKEENYFIYFEDGVNYQGGIVLEENQDGVKIQLEDDLIKTISIDEADNKKTLSYIYFRNAQDYNRATTLINDIGNKESHRFFKNNFYNFVKVKYILENYPKISDFLLKEIYGYASNFF